jgi:hypothetical protein
MAFEGIPVHLPPILFDHMTNTAKKWFTCTPVRFSGDFSFFARDSGLLCKGFQDIGVECKAIMPGPPMENDQVEDLIRTEYRNLEDPEWWSALGGDGVVFYGWGDGRYLGIVKAIKKAGLFLVSNMDTEGILGILNGFRAYGGNLWRISLGEARCTVAGIARFCIRFSYAATLSVLRNDITRSMHLKQADIISAITPIAVQRIKKVCRIYGGDSLANRVYLIPHATASYMDYDLAIAKERLVVAVGRWDDDKVKGTELLMQTVQICAERDPTLRFEIYGRQNNAMVRWHKSLPTQLQCRIHIKGVVSNFVIMQAYKGCRTMLFTSLRESYNISAAEALCCGCTVVGPDTPEIPSMKWFADGEYGRAAKRDAGSLAGAVIHEMQDWEAGRRKPQAIAVHWGKILHESMVARRILELADQATINDL